jgi:hypothetical protein
MLSVRKIAVNPGKVQYVLDWKAPRNVKQIQIFLGMVGYYGRFIKVFSKIVGPITKLLRKVYLLYGMRSMSKASKS